MSFLARIMPGKLDEESKLAAEFAFRMAVRPDHFPIRDFAKALAVPQAVIAEVKHKSPSHPQSGRMPRRPGWPRPIAGVGLLHFRWSPIKPISALLWPMWLPCARHPVCRCS